MPTRAKTRASAHTHTIEVRCLECDEDTGYSFQLPTAIRCSHCGMVFEARLALLKSKKA